jgi:hypothetical protein
MIFWTNVVEDKYYRQSSEQTPQPNFVENPFLVLETKRYGQRTLLLVKCSLLDVLAVVNMSVDCGLVACDAVQTCRSLPVFRMNASLPSSGYLLLRNVTVKKTAIVGRFLHWNVSELWVCGKPKYLDLRQRKWFEEEKCIFCTGESKGQYVASRVHALLTGVYWQDSSNAIYSYRVRCMHVHVMAPG